MGRQVSKQVLGLACNGEKDGDVRARILLVLRVKVDGVRPALEKVVRAGLDEEDVFVLKRCLRMVERIDKELKELDARIAMLVADKKKEMKNISKVSGVAQVFASSILVEIGDAERFTDGKKIASWSGLWRRDS